MSECQGQSDGPERPAAAAAVAAAAGSSGMDEKSSILSASENANNENREIELRQNAVEDVATVSEETSDDRMASSEPVSNASEGAATRTEAVPVLAATSQRERDALKEYAEHVTYDEHGDAIYTDPATKVRYKWDKVKNEWGAAVQDEASLENEHYRWCTEKREWVLKEAIENEHYRWCHDTQKWIPKAGVGGAIVRVEKGEHVYTDREGMTFFWDTEKNAWFPKIDDDFMAVYQMNYGFIDNTSAAKAPTEAPPKSTAAAAALDDKVVAEEEDEEEGATTEKPKSKRKAAEPPKWFDLDPEHNTKVYVSNLPLDITEEEFVALMSKCGLITRDIRTQKMKIKLYLEPDGSIKGDGLCDYIKRESVELALNILDGMDVRGKRISVQVAKFQMRGDYDPSKKPKKKQKREKEKEKKLKEKLFDWRPDKMRGERARHERIVIVKNLFAPETFEQKLHLLLDYQKNLREECAKCGSVRRVVVYDRHPDGVAQVTMADPEEADIVVQLLNNRVFGDRKLSAESWDGKTRYRTDETEEDAQKRLSQWSEHLANTENADSDDEPGAAVTAAAAPAITVAEPFQADNQPEAIRNE